MSSEQCTSQNSVCHSAEHTKEEFPHFSDQFSDVKVLALGEEFHLQKSILSQTPFFRSLLSRSWTGNRISHLRQSKCYKVHLFFRFHQQLVSIEIRDAKLYLVCSNKLIHHISFHHISTKLSYHNDNHAMHQVLQKGHNFE